MDTAYRTQLKELNQANFERFESKLDQRVAQLDAKIDQRAAQLDAKIEQRAAELKAELRGEIGRLEKSIERVQGELIKWTFLFWLGTIGIVVLLSRV